jgi:glutathione S-transferase
MPEIVLHGLPPSHPCMAAEAAIKLKGLEYERVDFAMTGEHPTKMAEIYGEGRTTVPGMLVDGEPVHTTRAIFERLDELVTAPPLLGSDAVREAERFVDDELQDLGRRLPWGALHFRPEAMGTLGGAAPLDPAGTDYAMKFARASWKYHGITAVRLAEDLAGLPAKLDRLDRLIADGVMGGDAPNGADLQAGSTLRVLLIIGDLRPLLEDRPCGQLAHRLFPHYPGSIPAGAFPAGWVPAA